MILSPILPECQGLLLFKEILIARAFPMMQLFIKPQYRTISYKVHVTLPHNLQKIADTAQKWSFPLRISLVNLTKSAVNCGFGHIY